MQVLFTGEAFAGLSKKESKHKDCCNELKKRFCKLLMEISSCALNHSLFSVTAYHHKALHKKFLTSW
jgi:hypothetical protein